MVLAAVAAWPGGDPGPSDWQWAFAVALTVAALMLRRRWPPVAAGGVVVVWIATHTDLASDDPPFQFVALLAASYALGAHARRRDGLLGLAAISIAFAAMNLGREAEAGAVGPGDAVAGAIQFGIMFVFGMLLGRAAEVERRAQRLEQERDERVREAVLDERARIARDLHDAVGHTVSALVLQVGVVRRRLTRDQAEERDVLVAAERAGRDAVGEMRRMLGMLRDDRNGDLTPLPSLARIEELAERSRAAGVPVEVSVEGQPASIPAGVDVAGYRIAQEALTNVLKHSGGARARIAVRYDDDAVAVEVADDGLARPGEPVEPGHGLIGMRERVTLYGGEFEAAPRDGGGFSVRARLPYGRNE